MKFGMNMLLWTTDCAEEHFPLFEKLKAMGYELTFEERTSGPINAILFDRAHGTMWGGSSNHGEDYGIAW